MSNQDWSKVKQKLLSGKKGKDENDLKILTLAVFQRRFDAPNFLRFYTKVKKTPRFAALDIQQVLSIFLEVRKLVFHIHEDAPVFGLDEVEIVENYIPTLGKVEEVKELDEVVAKEEDKRLFNF